MKKKKRNWIYSLMLIGYILILPNCDKKEEDSKIVKDSDGNVYHTVNIGTQVWLVENLKTTKYRNGEAIPEVKIVKDWIYLPTGAYCDYSNTASNSDIYGRLYNWHAVNDNRNICPIGWHVPSNEEWVTLFENLGGVYDAGGKMKEMGTSHWNSPNYGATNVSGFTALPGGYNRGTYDPFFGIALYARWWSATEAQGDASYDYNIDYNTDNVSRSFHAKWGGHSVRCIKD